MSLNKSSLNAAIKRHKPLVDEGKSEQEILDAIRADDKGFDEDGVQEIYNAITSPAKDKEKEHPKEKKAAYIVVKPFRDRNNFNHEHKAGHDVSHFDSDRLDNLIKNGHVEKQ